MWLCHARVCGSLPSLLQIELVAVLRPGAWVASVTVTDRACGGVTHGRMDRFRHCYERHEMLVRGRGW